MLVAHVCDTWLKCLVDNTQTSVASANTRHKDNTMAATPTPGPTASISGDPPSSTAPPTPTQLSLGGLAAIKAVIASMKAHTDLLIKAVTFGPVHKKNIRLVTVNKSLSEDGMIRRK